MLIVSLAASEWVVSAEPVDYAAKIAPLFQEHCVDCHGKDDPEGEFNLETFENLMTAVIARTNGQCMNGHT